MTNQETLREIQRGYRLEKPRYEEISGAKVGLEKLNGIYAVSSQNYIFVSRE